MAKHQVNFYKATTVPPNATNAEQGSFVFAKNGNTSRLYVKDPTATGSAELVELGTTPSSVTTSSVSSETITVNTIQTNSEQIEIPDKVVIKNGDSDAVSINTDGTISANGNISSAGDINATGSIKTGGATRIDASGNVSANSIITTSIAPVSTSPNISLSLDNTDRAVKLNSGSNSASIFVPSDNTLRVGNTLHVGTTNTHSTIGQSSISTPTVTATSALNVGPSNGRYLTVGNEYVTLGKPLYVQDVRWTGSTSTTWKAVDEIQFSSGTDLRNCVIHIQGAITAKRNGESSTWGITFYYTGVLPPGQSLYIPNLFNQNDSGDGVYITLASDGNNVSVETAERQTMFHPIFTDSPIMIRPLLYF